MAVFDLALPNVLKYEGPYDCDPDDPGGETVYGITKTHEPNWTGWARVDSLRGEGFPKNVTHDLEIQKHVASYYLALWDSFKLSEIDHQGLAECVYNGCINQGAKRVIGWLQYCVNAFDAEQVTEDGASGPSLIHAIAGLIALNKGDLLFTLLKAKRQAAYIETAHNRPASKKYLAGWSNRLQNGG